MYGKRKWSGSRRRGGRGGRGRQAKRRPVNVDEATVNSAIKIIKDAFQEKTPSIQSDDQALNNLKTIETGTIGQIYREQTDKNFKTVLKCTPTMFLHRFPEHFVKVDESHWRTTTEEERTIQEAKKVEKKEAFRDDQQRQAVFRKKKEVEWRFRKYMQYPLQPKNRFTVITSSTSSMEKHAIRRAITIVAPHTRGIRHHPRVIVCGVDVPSETNQKPVGHAEIVRRATNQLHQIVDYRTMFTRSQKRKPQWLADSEWDPDFEFSAVRPEDLKDEKLNRHENESKETGEKWRDEMNQTLSLIEPQDPAIKIDENENGAGIPQVELNKQEKQTKPTRLDVADYYISIERGLFQLDVPLTYQLQTANTNTEGSVVSENSSWHEVSWVVVHDPESGIVTRACSAGVKFPSDIVEEVRQRGLDTNDVGSVISEQLTSEPCNENIIGGHDPVMDLSSNVVGRGHMLESALVVCLSRIEAMNAQHKRRKYFAEHQKWKQEEEQVTQEVDQTQNVNTETIVEASPTLPPTAYPITASPTLPTTAYPITGISMTDKYANITTELDQMAEETTGK